MAEYIAGFICALVLAALLVVWLIYCMFVRERHKSESHQYHISDLVNKNKALESNEECVEKKTGLAAGIFILPSRHKHKEDEYNNSRPDYPESPVPMQVSTEKLVEILNDSTDDFYKDGLEINSNATYQSDV